MHPRRAVTDDSFGANVPDEAYRVVTMIRAETNSAVWSSAADPRPGYADSIEAVCEARLTIQSDLIEQHSIRSIVEDRHQKLAVEYFAWIAISWICGAQERRR